MADKKILEVRLDNPELTPGKMSSRQIAKLIDAVEKLIAPIVTREFPELDLEEEDVTVGLSAIQIGSYGVQFESQFEEPVAKAFDLAMDAIKNLEFDILPMKSRTALRDIQKVSMTYHTPAKFGYRNGSFEELAQISSTTPLEAPAPEVEGETTIYGTVTSIGGDNPPRAILLLANGDKLRCNITERGGLRVAKELGKRLYSEVGVKGIARWNLSDMSMSFFRIDEVLDFEDRPITEALSNLYPTLGVELEKIDDLEAYFSDLRDEEEVL